MQLRISPGGSTSNSRRSRPELPPSSLTVTTAVMSTVLARCLRPCRSADSPVPPPIATTRRGTLSSMDNGYARVYGLPPFFFRIKQRVERRLVGKRREVRVLPRHDAVARLELDGAPQVLVGVRHVAGERLRQRQRVMDVVGARRHLQRPLEMRARLRY